MNKSVDSRRGLRLIVTPSNASRACDADTVAERPDPDVQAIALATLLRLKGKDPTIDLAIEGEIAVGLVVRAEHESHFFPVQPIAASRADGLLAAARRAASRNVQPESVGCPGDWTATCGDACGACCVSRADHWTAPVVDVATRAALAPSFGQAVTIAAERAEDLPIALWPSPLGHEASSATAYGEIDWNAIEPDPMLAGQHDECAACGGEQGDHVLRAYDAHRRADGRPCTGYVATAPAPAAAAFPVRLSFEFETGEWAEEFFDACDAGGVGRSHRVVDVEVRSALEADQARDVAARMHGREVGKAGA